MENKTTSELLEILWKIEKKDGGDEWDKYEEAFAELCKRPPFKDLIGQKEEANEYSHEERLDNIEEDIKLLKRHKHDEHSGDVLIRI